MGGTMKSERNKTIDMSIKQGAEYLAQCISVNQRVSLHEVLDKTILGDTMRVLQYLPANSIDLLIIDPPYNLNKDFHGAKFKKMTDEEYEKYVESWLMLMLPLLKETATVYVCCDWRSSSAIERVLKRYLYIQNRITWQREKGRGSQNNWKNGMEDIWFATVSKKYTFNVDAVKCRRRVVAPYKQDGAPKDWEETAEGKFRDTYPSNFWDDISIPYWSMPENTAHPTQKPEKLLAKLILASSNPDDVVLDPFAGSGSTAVTAKKLGRHYIGIEKNPQYCVWAEFRLEKATTDKTIQGYTNGVFWERNTKVFQKRSAHGKNSNSIYRKSTGACEGNHE
jgi:site-specific DNA-methyltransferase (adenine-specific)